jgi:hypothetical protein
VQDSFPDDPEMQSVLEESFETFLAQLREER